MDYRDGEPRSQDSIVLVPRWERETLETSLHDRFDLEGRSWRSGPFNRNQAFIPPSPFLIQGVWGDRSSPSRPYFSRCFSNNFERETIASISIFIYVYFSVRYMLTSTGFSSWNIHTYKHMLYLNTIWFKAQSSKLVGSCENDYKWIKLYKKDWHRQNQFIVLVYRTCLS